MSSNEFEKLEEALYKAHKEIARLKHELRLKTDKTTFFVDNEEIMAEIWSKSITSDVTVPPGKILLEVEFVPTDMSIYTPHHEPIERKVSGYGKIIGIKGD